MVAVTTRPTIIGLPVTPNRSLTPSGRWVPGSGCAHHPDGVKTPPGSLRCLIHPIGVVPAGPRCSTLPLHARLRPRSCRWREQPMASPDVEAKRPRVLFVYYTHTQQALRVCE